MTADATVKIALSTGALSRTERLEPGLMKELTKSKNSKLAESLA
jgi:hypothetical protein